MLERAVARLAPAHALYLDPGFRLKLPTQGLTGRLFWATAPVTLTVAALAQKLRSRGRPPLGAADALLRDAALARFDRRMTIGVFRDVAHHPAPVAAPVVPSTIVLSDDSPAVLPDATAERLADLGWEVRRLPGVGHDFWLEDADRTVDGRARPPRRRPRTGLTRPPGGRGGAGAPWPNACSGVVAPRSLGRPERTSMVLPSDDHVALRQWLATRGVEAQRAGRHPRDGRPRPPAGASPGRTVGWSRGGPAGGGRGTGDRAGPAEWPERTTWVAAAGRRTQARAGLRGPGAGRPAPASRQRRTRGSGCAGATSCSRPRSCSGTCGPCTSGWPRRRRASPRRDRPACPARAPRRLRAGRRPRGRSR